MAEKVPLILAVKESIVSFVTCRSGVTFANPKPAPRSRSRFAITVEVKMTSEAGGVEAARVKAALLPKAMSIRSPLKKFVPPQLIAEVMLKLPVKCCTIKGFRTGGSSSAADVLSKVNVRNALNGVAFGASI